MNKKMWKVLLVILMASLLMVACQPETVAPTAAVETLSEEEAIEMLQDLGYDVERADDGELQTAIEALEEAGYVITEEADDDNPDEAIEEAIALLEEEGIQVELEPTATPRPRPTQTPVVEAEPYGVEDIPALLERIEELEEGDAERQLLITNLIAIVETQDEVEDAQETGAARAQATIAARPPTEDDSQSDSVMCGDVPDIVANYLGEDAVCVEECGHGLWIEAGRYDPIANNRGIDACSVHLHNDTVSEQSFDDFDGFSNRTRFVVIPAITKARNDLRMLGSDPDDSVAIWFLGSGWADVTLHADGDEYHLGGEVGIGHTDDDYSNMWVSSPNSTYDGPRPATFSIVEFVENGVNSVDAVVGFFDSKFNSEIRMNIGGPTNYYKTPNDGWPTADQGQSIWRDNLKAR